MTVTLRRLHRLVLLVLAACALAVLGAAPAQAADSTKLLRDCQDGSISGSYSQADYKRALADIPTDVDEYTDCRSVIRAAQLKAAGGSNGTSGAAGGALGGTSGGGTSSGGGTAGATGSGGATGAGLGTADAASAGDVLRGASPQERAGVEAARAGAAAPVQIAGAAVRPQQLVTGAGLASASLPTPVLLSLVGLGLATLVALGLWAKRLVDARRTVRA